MSKNENTDTTFSASATEDFFEQSLSGFLIADSYNLIVQSNPRLANWLGKTVDELKGNRFSDLLSIGSKIYYETHLLPLLRMQGFFEEILIEIYDASGKKLKVLLNAVVPKNKENVRQAIYYTLLKAIKIAEPINCDGDRIGQLLSNLIANAITHGTPNSPIFINAVTHNKTLKISVTNSGKPIPTSLQNLLFEPFTKEEDQQSKNGLGLGLYISSEIAKAHKGTFRFVSNTNETCFTFSMLL